LIDFEVSRRKLALIAIKAGKHTYEARYSGQQAVPTTAPTAPAPEVPTVAPEISTVAPEVSTVAPEVSTVAPTLSAAAPTLSSADAPTSVPAGGASPALPQASVPPIFWVIATIVIVLVAVVAVLVGRGRFGRR
jgi:hypothetical protein